MSALAMILTAAMVVPGDGRERVSMEMVQVFDLSGEWKARWIDDRWGVGIETAPHKLLANTVFEGVNKLRITYRGGCHLGIYKEEANHVVICLREPGRGRPRDFRVKPDQELLILHRAKPRK